MKVVLAKCVRSADSQRETGDGTFKIKLNSSRKKDHETCWLLDFIQISFKLISSCKSLNEQWRVFLPALTGFYISNTSLPVESRQVRLFLLFLVKCPIYMCFLSYTQFTGFGVLLTYTTSKIEVKPVWKTKSRAFYSINVKPNET